MRKKDKTDYRLSTKAKIALWRLSEDDVVFENLDPHTQQELIERRLVDQTPDGDYQINERGEYAVGKDIAVVYPLTPNNTAKGYNKVLQTMTPAAMNALVCALAAVGPSFFNKDLHMRNVGYLFERLIAIGFTKRIPRPVMEDLLDNLRLEIEYYLKKDDPDKRIEERFSSYSDEESKLEGDLKTELEKIGTKKLSRPLHLSSSARALELRWPLIIIEHGDGTKSEVSIDEVSVRDLYRIYKSE